METLIAPAFNVILLLALFVVYLRKPVRDFVSNRHQGLRDELQKVREQLKQAQEQYDEFSAKLKAIDVEISALREQVKQDAEATKYKVMNDANKSAETILADARATANGLYADLRNSLREDFAAQVLDRAETFLKERLTGDDKARIRKEFSKQVESISGRVS